MIRRKFMKYAPKEHNDEKVKKTLEKHNVPVFEGNQPAKFGQFGNVAKDLAAKSRKTFAAPDGGQVASADKAFSWQQKAVYGDGGTGVAGPNADARNPYAVSQPKGNPYASRAGSGGGGGGGNPYGGGAPPAGGNPYGGGSSASPASGSPYGSSSTAYSRPSKSSRSQYSPPAPASSGASTYGDAGAGRNPYGGAGTGSGPDVYSNSSGALYDSDFGGPPDTSARSAAGGAPYGAVAAAGAGGAAAAAGVGGAAGAIGGPRSGGGFVDASRPSGDGFNRFEPPSAHKQEFGEPLARTQTNQSNSTAAIRNELFGSAAQRANPDADEFDELNRTHTELENEDELLTTHQNLDQPGFTGASGGAAASAASAFPDTIPEDVEPEDELNQLPSDFKQPVEVASIYGGSAGPGGAGAGPGYRSGQQLFEDSEDEDVEYTKREIRQTKQESVESTRRALQIASEAEMSGRNAMGMLGDQGERLGNSAKTVALGHVQARVGASNAEELQRLNRSIFIPNVSNPFNSRKRNQMREQRLKSEKEFDRMERDALEAQQRESERRVAEGLNGAGFGYSETAMRYQQRANRDNPERKMYQFEADSDDDALEDELEQNLDGISDAAKRLHGLSLKINDEVSDQNRRIEQMGGRVDDLDYSLHKSTAKMATIN